MLFTRTGSLCLSLSPLDTHAWEGGTECVQIVVVKWKDKGATLKCMEGLGTYPLNLSWECVDKW